MFTRGYPWNSIGNQFGCSPAEGSTMIHRARWKNCSINGAWCAIPARPSPRGSSLASHTWKWFMEPKKMLENDGKRWKMVENDGKWWKMVVNPLQNILSDLWSITGLLSCMVKIKQDLSTGSWRSENFRWETKLIMLLSILTSSWPQTNLTSLKLC